MLAIYYVKKLDGKCKVMWNGYFASSIDATKGNEDISSEPLANYNVSADKSYSSLMKDTSFNLNQEYTNPAGIHPDLKMENGEVKIILQMSFYAHSNYYVGGTSEYNAVTNSKKLFNFFLLPIKVENGNNLFFRNTIIFSPNRGLFDDNKPV
jgi:hypothetical protein